MIRIQGRAAIYGEVWFDEVPQTGTGVDILRFQRRSAPVENARTTPFLSLVTALAESSEEIAGRFTRDCRYKIRRADTKDGLQMELLLEPQERLDEFCGFYDDFAREKSLPPCDREWLAAAAQVGQLALASASRQGETLVRHAYLLSGRNAWLQHSASCFRSRENDFRALISRANRWLHWQAMLQLKELGVERYDWGGLFADESTPERAGINRFKREFGGFEVHSYDCIVPLTLKGRIYLPLREAWRRHAARSHDGHG